VCRRRSPGGGSWAGRRGGATVVGVACSGPENRRRHRTRTPSREGAFLAVYDQTTLRSHSGSHQDRLHRAWPKVDLQLDDSVAGANQSRDDKLLAGLAAGNRLGRVATDIRRAISRCWWTRNSSWRWMMPSPPLPISSGSFPGRVSAAAGGKLWGVPFGVEFGQCGSTRCLQQGGIKAMPKTWGELLDINRTIKSAGIQPMNISFIRTNPGTTSAFS